MKKDMQIELDKLNFQIQKQNTQSILNRARSVTVGNCFNGMVEIILRGSDGAVLYCHLAQEEVIEMIYTLAGTVGVNINISPRDDFSSWRKWNNLQTKEITNEPSVAAKKNIDE